MMPPGMNEMELCADNKKPLENASQGLRNKNWMKVKVSEPALHPRLPDQHRWHQFPNTLL